MLLTVFLGSLIGLVMGLTGAGGGILAVPALVVGLGFTMTAAAPVSLMAVGVSALVGAIDGLSKKIVRYRAAALMAALGSLTSYIGIGMARILPESTLMTLFAGVMLLAAWRMARDRHHSHARGAPEPPKNCMINPDTGKLRWTPRCAATLAGIGAATGLFAGLLGVGGGFIMVPAFRRFTNVDMHGIVATSLCVIALISIGTVTTLLVRGTHIVAAGWHFVAAAVAGMIVGRLLTAHMPAHLLQSAFAAIAAAAAAIMLLRTYAPGVLT